MRRAAKVDANGIRPPKPKSTILEATFDQCWKAIGGAAPVCEMVFDDKRRWRLDRAWPEKRIAIELEGGIHSDMGWKQKSRHLTPTGFMDDCMKYNAAAMAGYRVIRMTAEHIQPKYLEEIRDALGLAS